MLNGEPVLGLAYLLKHVSVHFVNLSNSVPSWGLSILWTFSNSLILKGSVHFVGWILIPCGVRLLCGYEFWSLVGSLYFVDLCKFLTFVGSVHFVDMNLDSSWDPFTAWINVKVYPYKVRPFCGLIMFLTLVRSVHFVDLRKRFTLIGSVHFVDLCRRFTLIGSVHFMDLCRIFPLWGMSSFQTSLVVNPRRVHPLTVVLKHSLV